MLKRTDLLSLLLLAANVFLTSQLLQLTETFIALQFSMQQHITILTLLIASATAFLIFRNFGEIIAILFSEESQPISRQRAIAQSLLIALSLVFALRLLYRL